MARIKGITSDNTEKDIRATERGELEVRAITEPEIEHFSATGDSFVWNSGTADIDAGDTFLFVKNTDNALLLVLDRLIIGGSDVACKWDIGIGALTDTPSGTALTAVNMNEDYSTKTHSYLAYRDETAVADATPAMTVWTPASETREYSLAGFILGTNHYIQVNQETESTQGTVIIMGHYTEEAV